MKLLQAAREWWQRTSGEEETPLDGDSPAFVVSLLVHLAVLVTLGLLPLVLDSNQVTLTVAAVPEEKQVELKLPEEFYFSEQPAEEVGANSAAGEAMALSLAPVISELSQIPNHVEVETTSTVATVEINNAIEVATGLHYSENLAVKGAAGEGTTGASGAIDRITHEILLSLEERKTLVVWLFDGTASLVPQRQAIHDRFEKIYEELGIIEAAGGESFAKYEDKPLLSSIVAFGSSTQLLTKKPTDNVAELREAVAGIKKDESGIVNVFGAFHDRAKHYASFR